MSAKKISYGSDARDLMISGVDALANAVKLLLSSNIPTNFSSRDIMVKRINYIRECSF